MLKNSGEASAPPQACMASSIYDGICLVGSF